MQAEQLRRLLEDAANQTVTGDRDLFENNNAERAIAGRLAMKLQELLPNWKVDTEYNRMNGGHPKRVVLPPECEGYRNSNNEAFASPDIIVHSRGPEGPNLLVLELKKTTNSDNGGRDRLRLKAFREQLGYKFGALIKCETGRGRIPAMNVEWHD